MGLTSRCALLAIGTLIVAQSAAAQNPATSSAGIRVAKERTEPPTPPPPPPPAPAPTPAPPPRQPEPWNFPFTSFDIRYYNGMNEAQLAWHMATVDTLRLQLASIGVKKVSEERGRDFITAAAQGDVPHVAKLTEIIVDEKVGATPIPEDPEVERLRQAVKKFYLMPPGRAFDAAFFEFQVQHYQNEMGVLIQARGVVHDDDFEKFVDQTRPELEKRREAAFSNLPRS